MKTTAVFNLFATCADAIARGTLIRQVSKTDKEFHFQNWIEERFGEGG